jgi:hypothetical protein
MNSSSESPAYIEEKNKLKKRKPFDFIIIFKGIEINKKYLI